MINWLKNIFVNKEQQQIQQTLKDCGCVCYCPKCKAILNAQASASYNHDGDVVYTCFCGRVSTWDFDFPVPFCRDNI